MLVYGLMSACTPELEVQESIEDVRVHLHVIVNLGCRLLQQCTGDKSIHSNSFNNIVQMKQIIYSYQEKLAHGVLQRRYKRFLADIILKGHTDVSTIYCPNTGSMLNLVPPALPTPHCCVSVSSNS